MTALAPQRGPNGDPIVPDWHQVQVTDAWVDRMSFLSLRAPWVFISHVVRSILGRPIPVEIPRDIPYHDDIPDYFRQNYHGLPNGYFSRNLPTTYHQGFEFAMLGRAGQVRDWAADQISDAKRVLDVGCAGGTLSGVIKRRGVPEVWGVDPNPYALKHAGVTLDDVHIAFGVGEHLPFNDGRFDAVATLYVVHEIPVTAADAMFAEVYRVLEPGGRFVIVEPSPYHWFASFPQLLMRFELANIYFKLLAVGVWEPFIREYHAEPIAKRLEKAGFNVVFDETEQMMPFHRIVACKPGR